MNSRETMLKTLNCETADQIPVTPHWWGLYKFQLAGFLTGYDREAEAWSITGQELAEVDSLFYEKFHPDMFHLTTGAPKIKESEAIREEKRRIFEAVYKLESYSIIDEYIDSHYQDKEEIIKSGIFDHIQILSDKYKNECVLMLNEGNPISWILDPHGCVGFENGLISMIDKADKMEYLINKCYEAILPRMEALKEMGGDGYIGSETYCSADIMSPDMYRNLIFEAQKKFYTALDRMGLIPVVYFLGDINPLLDDIKQLGVKGLMVEESKKNFTLDIGSIYDRLEGQVCLFGNLDSVYILQKGSREDVVRETRRQISVCNRGSFVMANGCPISFNTPQNNILAMIETVHNEGRVR
ncbi:uroporphyrinogen decarboxylase family protein [Mahella australiensis]|uniref:Uroporphyrinogen decarboxylase (URO-D) domain-containing protein n=1 Tax=Mahella australiensis (strain DSM 15567 / CIP 107919 / 50-1 BON) TaxID=697281 RepID=F4A111_MAHA5|nr:uroporphyrinogen decarboxylase family protein [Mahella australiensis]AEE98088.1 hypothetical protein Mahau_2968 [Mahella australiensis 50-1 BON]